MGKDKNNSKEIIRYIPGFRSNTTWKKIIAMLYYLSCSFIIFATTLFDGLIFLSFPFIIFYGYDFLSRRDIRRHVPGFRSNTTWKKIIAYSYYIVGLIVFVGLILGLKDNTTGIFRSLVVILLMMLIYYWPITMYNIYLLLKGKFSIEEEENIKTLKIEDNNYDNLKEDYENLLNKYNRLLIHLSENKKNQFFLLEKTTELDGFEFEEYVYREFKKIGLNVEKTPKSGDFGVDLIVRDVDVAIQLKNYTSSTIGISAIQEIHSGADYYNLKAVVIGTNKFTSAAIELAEALNVEVIDDEGIKAFGNTKLSLEKYGRFHNYLTEKINEWARQFDVV